MFRIDLAAGNPTLFNAPNGGRGIAFDEVGNLDVAAWRRRQAVGRSRRTSTPTGPPSATLATLAGAYGIGMNACREMVVGVAVRQHRPSVGLTATGSADHEHLVSQGKGSNVYRPLHLEVDWSNRIYINAGTSNDGADSRLMVAVPNLGAADGGRGVVESRASTTTLSTLVELKTTGPGRHHRASCRRRLSALQSARARISWSIHFQPRGQAATSTSLISAASCTKCR